MNKSVQPTEIREPKIHPLAAIFPMIEGDELDDLAQDIKTNGLNQPIVLDEKGVLIDGRNRLAACRLAGVEPTFETRAGDPTAFILSQNIRRRHMTAGQRAMATAMLYPQARQGRPAKGMTSKTEELLAAKSFSGAALSQARMVLRDQALAERVLAGTLSLIDAYDEVRRDANDTANEAARLRKLRAERSDLADKVVQQEIKLDAAEKQAVEDAKALKQARWAATMNIVEGVQLLEREISEVAEYVEAFDPSVAEQRGQTVTPERLRRVAAFVSAFADAMEGGDA